METAHARSPLKQQNGRADDWHNPMGIPTDDLLRRAEALAQAGEPTSEMIAASAAEVAEPAFASLKAS